MKTTITHKMSYERRKKIASDFDKGLRVPELCKKYKVSRVTVTNALDMFDKKRPVLAPKNKTLLIIKCLMDGVPVSDICKIYNTSKTRVYVIKDTAMCVGFPLKRFKTKRKYNAKTKILESPSETSKTETNFE